MTDIATNTTDSEIGKPLEGEQLIRRLANYATAPSSAHADEDFALQLQECIENNTTYYIPTDELTDTLSALAAGAPTSVEDALLLVQEQLTRVSTFYVSVDELRASIQDLNSRGWHILHSPSSCTAGFSHVDPAIHIEG